jgi:hypothetical protein
LHRFAKRLSGSGNSEALVQLLVFNYKRGDEYAFIPLAVPVDVLKFCSIPQVLPHTSTVRSPQISSEPALVAFFLWRGVSSTPVDRSWWPCVLESRESLRVVCY